MTSTNWKRVAELGDIGAACLLLILTLPLCALIALSIKLDSPGPVFAREERIGRDGCRYRALMFRTRVYDLDRHREQIRNGTEPEFTRIGWLLWYTRLEKLPQLINVLQGDMSCISTGVQCPHFLS